MPIVFIFLSLILYQAQAFGETYSYKDSLSLSSRDYLLKDNSERRDRVFDKYEILEADINLAIGSDCGSIDLRGSLQSSLRNIINNDYFKNVGQNIVSSAPGLLLAYLSPSWAAFIRNGKLNAGLMSKFRLSQCALVDKYIDSRVEDYEIARQSCMRKALQSNGGNAERALEQCGKNSYQFDLANWAGQKSGSSTKVNRLIESSAKWAGFKGREAQRVIDMAKALVGDTVLVSGRVRVDFGPKGKAVTPRMMWIARKSDLDKQFSRIFRKVELGGGESSIYRTVSDEDLEKLSGGNEKVLVSRDIIRSLYLMPKRKRKMAYEKLSSAIATHTLATEAGKALDLLMVASKNPNLPRHRKVELDDKRRSLQDALESTITITQQKNIPVNSVLASISEEGNYYHQRNSKRNFDSDAARVRQEEVYQSYFDCSDGFMCEEGS